MEQEASRAKGVGDIDAVDLNGAIAKGKKAMTALDEFAEGSKHWTAPLDFNETLSSLQTLVKSWDLAVKALENVRDQLHRVIQDSKGARADEKKHWHEQKKKLETYFVANATGAGLALCKVFAEL